MLRMSTLTWPISTPQLHSQELTLLPWKNAAELPNILEDLVSSCQDSAMQEFTQVPHPYTPDMAHSFLADQQAVRWALRTKNRYCGNIELRLESLTNLTASLGYNTAPWARGQGLMKQALPLVINHALSQGLYRIELRAAVNNTASRRVAEACGLTFEGIARGAEHLGSRIHDLALYSALAGEKIG